MIRPLLLSASSLALLACTASAQDNTPAPADLTIVLQGYLLPKKDAAAILMGQGAILDAMPVLKQATGAGAKVAKIATLKAKSGQVAKVDQRDVFSEVDAVVSPDRKLVNLNLRLSLNRDGLELVTAVTARLGGVCYLGAFDGPTKDSAELIFMRVTSP